MTSPAPGHSTLQRQAGPGATAWASARQATGTATGKARQGTDGDSLPHADGETSPAPCPRTTPVRSSPKVRGSRPRARPPPSASAPAERGCSASAGHGVALAVRAGGPGAFVCVAAGRERARTALQSWALHHQQHLDLGHVGWGVGRLQGRPPRQRPAGACSQRKAWRELWETEGKGKKTFRLLTSSRFFHGAPWGSRNLS